MLTSLSNIYCVIMGKHTKLGAEVSGTNDIDIGTYCPGEANKKSLERSVRHECIPIGPH